MKEYTKQEWEEAVRLNKLAFDTLYPVKKLKQQLLDVYMEVIFEGMSIPEKK